MPTLKADRSEASIIIIDGGSVAVLPDEIKWAEDLGPVDCTDLADGKLRDEPGINWACPLDVDRDDWIDEVRSAGIEEVFEGMESCDTLFHGVSFDSAVWRPNQ